jgi:transcriptional regulator with XRE-family HTH domain
MTINNTSGSQESESPLKKLREEAGLSQEGLARIIGVASATISRWERGASPAMMTVPQMKALCKVFGKVLRSCLTSLGHQSDRWRGSEEEYLAEKLLPYGWYCCWGETMKSVDFCTQNGDLLQVKNRSNSENSSSNKIRQGTAIIKWHRINASNGSLLLGCIK